MKNFSGLSLALGIVGIVLSTVFGILFGFIPALIGLGCGVAALVLAINTKKATNNEQGTGGFVCGIFAVVLGSIFFIGCLACGSIIKDLTGGNYGAYGIVGGSCNAVDDARDAVLDSYRDVSEEDVRAFNDAMKELADAFKDFE